MNKRFHFRSFFLGIVTAVTVMGLAVPAFAAAVKNIQVSTGIRIFVSGRELFPTDANGNPAEAFLYDNSVYLPAYAVGEALGKDVQWDISTQSVYISESNRDVSKEFLVEQKVRLADETGWKDKVSAKIGDEVVFQFQYKNTGENVHSNVTVRDTLNENLKLISGSVRLYNSSYPDGVPIDAKGALFADGYNIGSYAAGANAYVRFTAKVVDTSLKKGNSTLKNVSKYSVGQVTLEDSISVTVRK
ncbi:MAG: DUF11 domain-containing protein [Oscillospiraceae bacterium]|nr:DUF11 domain-containing protein [Oscillospiraceae bacterium]